MAKKLVYMSTIDSCCELKRSLSIFFLPDLTIHNAEIYFKQQQQQQSQRNKNRKKSERSPSNRFHE